MAQDLNNNFWNNFDSERLIAAHRGYRAVRPENTLSAFETSIGKCDFVELDVGFSSDGMAIIIHDDTLERTSNAKEIDEFCPPYNVLDYSYESLLKLDITSWFLISDPFDSLVNTPSLEDKIKKLPIQRIPTLHESLTLLKSHNMPVNVEIKDMNNTVFDRVAVSKTIDIISELGMDEMVLLSSFNHSYMKEAEKLAPNICRAALQEDKHHDNLVEYLKDLNVQCYHSDVEIIDEKLVQEITEAGIIVNIYTVNDLAKQRELFSWGVKSIFSDYCI